MCVCVCVCVMSSVSLMRHYGSEFGSLHKSGGKVVWKTVSCSQAALKKQTPDFEFSLPSPRLVALLKLASLLCLSICP